jgi:23S rRNA pseudouridine1911/1915/1917 synthase
MAMAMPAAMDSPASSAAAPADGVPAGWLPAAVNQGWSYRDRVEPPLAGLPASVFYAARHRHSDRACWQARLAAGEIWRNGQPLLLDAPLASGDRLVWRRPPWLEGAVPADFQVVYDDGDLQVIDKPAGLPVLPAGGWLEHTLLRLLERRHRGAGAAIPRPVHRLGRYTSGLLVCARQPQTRAWLSASLRESTAAGLAGAAAAAAAADGSGAAAVGEVGGCRKLYRALVVPGALPLVPGETLLINTAIGRREHPQLGQIWCAAADSQPGDLAASSSLTLLECSPQADLVQVSIASGRPHQIRIHCAAVGAPLWGDPLYGPGGLAAAAARPGDGGYQLQAWRLELQPPSGEALVLEAPRALGLGGRQGGDGVAG